MKKLNKKAASWLTENLIFYIINIIFFVILFVAIAKYGSGSYFYEETYAKQIALIIDKAKPNTYIELDITDLRNQAKNNKYNEDQIVKLENNNIIVKTSPKGGYTMKHFTNNKVLFGYKGTNKEILTIRIE